MDQQMLQNTIAKVPAGRWAVGVSGGADSVALSLLLSQRPDLSLHIAHLDHQTRDGESGEDAKFVRELAARLKLPCTIALRCEIESGMAGLLKNTSSRFRKARFELFSRVVNEQRLQGVLLAHHADDKAETVLLRILRGTSAGGLSAMRPTAVVAGLKIVRPFLEVTADELREFLRRAGQDWRDDPSNLSDQYQRNRVRRFLKTKRPLRDGLLKIAADTEALRWWLDQNAPALPTQFIVEILADLPPPLARHSVISWLVYHGAPAREVTIKVAERLIDMAKDAASPARQEFPGKLTISRRRGQISCQTGSEPDRLRPG